jgi:signal transduction histidine kinase
MIAVTQSPTTGGSVTEQHRNAIGATIDEALVQVASSYVDQRDHEARRMRGDYIGFVTHELRNPLTTAMVAGSRLQFSDRPSDVARAIDLVQRNLRRLGRLIDDFLLTEQMGADAIHMHPVDMLLSEIVNAAVAPAFQAAQRPEVILNVSVDPTVVVRVDPALTIAAMQNLIINAIHFTDRNLVVIKSEERADRVIVHLCDNCRGLPAEKIATLFEPFHGAHPDKPVPGLGLSVARRIIQEQGGTIEVESSAEGCHLRVELPKPLRRATTGAGADSGSNPDRR